MDTPQQIDDLVAEYLLAVERGEKPDKQQWIDSHPHFAEELRAFFDADTQLRSANVGTTAPDTYRIPARIGNYEILDEIARGGMGVVYKAQDTELGRVVALKMLLTGSFSNTDAVQRFRAEAAAAARLNHDGIVPIHGVARHDGFDYYTMAFVEGESLDSLLERGPLSPTEAATLLCRVARAVAFAHDQRVLHRDLKPANILIDQDGQPKITDFGVAKCLDETRCLTGTGEILGTLQFMAPEQAAADHDVVSETADIYSLGAILFAALTGRAVFASNSHVDLLLKILEQEPDSPRELVSSVPTELEAICLRCLEKKPARRYQSAHELAEDLECFLRDELPSTAAHVTWGARFRRWARRRPLLVAHVGTLLLVELFRHTKYLLGGADDEVEFQPEFTLIFALWIAACFVFQKLLEHPRRQAYAPYLWSATDVILLTVCLSLTRGPTGMLLTTYALLIVISGMFRQVRLVFSVTAVCLAALTMLVVTQPNTTPAHYPIVLAAVLVATSVVVAYHVRRFGYLSQFYERFR